MNELSHQQSFFNRYVRKIDELVGIYEIIPWELYEVKTPYDLTVNGLNFEIKIQKCNANSLGLEQYTNHDKKIRGWVHKLKENFVDIVLFFYPYSNNYLGCYAYCLQDWWELVCDNFEIYKNNISRDRNGNIWQSSFSYVDIINIPKKIIWYSDIKRREIGLEKYM